ncbi:MAG: zinc-ribbon domain-containing protein [Armatimonadetes bacterium]|nr:zinc-ribbon domain-containing protein [Armatimonadota bacterium]
MNCPKCGLENPDGASFCNRCGKELAVASASVPGEIKFCYRHPKVETQLSCGRCERPVCTKCVVLGPAGPRCRDCSKLNIPVRPGAVVHDVKRGLGGLFRGGPWTIYIWILLISTLGATARGCMGAMAQQRQRQHLESTSDRRQQPSEQSSE